MCPGARDDGTNRSDGEHSEIHYVGVIVLISDDANCAVYPDEDEHCTERNTGGAAGRLMGSLQ